MSRSKNVAANARTPKTLKSLADLIRKLHAMPESGFASGFGDTPMAWFQRGRKGVALTGDDATIYWRVVQDIHSEAFAKGHGRQAIEQQVQSAVLKAIDATDVEVGLAGVIQDLRDYPTQSSREWLVLLPVLGIDPRDLPLRFGGARFTRISKNRLAALRTHVGRRNRRHIGDGLLGAPVVAINVTAVDSGAAQEAARTQRLRILDAIGRAHAERGEAELFEGNP